MLVWTSCNILIKYTFLLFITTFILFYFNSPLVQSFKRSHTIWFYDVGCVLEGVEQIYICNTCWLQKIFLYFLTIHWKISNAIYGPENLHNFLTTQRCWNFRSCVSYDQRSVQIYTFLSSSSFLLRLILMQKEHSHFHFRSCIKVWKELNDKV